jgi:DNA-directed RNA polymerase specialized sigma24 family protein
MSYHEIADELHLTVPTVRNRIMRAKIRLRNLLTPYIQQ